MTAAAIGLAGVAFICLALGSYMPSLNAHTRGRLATGAIVLGLAAAAAGAVA